MSGKTQKTHGEYEYMSHQARIFLGRHRGYHGEEIDRQTIERFIAERLGSTPFVLDDSVILYINDQIVREPALVISTFKPETMADNSWMKILRDLIFGLKSEFEQEEIHLERTPIHRTVFF